MIAGKQVKIKFIDHLNSIYSISEAEELFWLSIEHVLQLDRIKLKLKGNIELTEDQELRLHQILNELETGKPIQYILGYTWFFNQKFTVSNSVLIPRPETEELVSLILEENKNNNPKVLDIGTGSGCIAISLKKYLSDNSEVFGIDISPNALKLAKENSERLNCKVTFLIVDILNEDPKLLKEGQKFDIIVSNPPYITPQEKLSMHKNVLDFEPHIALFVKKDSPLIFYSVIADYAKKQLNIGGKLYFEINQGYGREVMEMLKSKRFRHIHLYKDMGGNERMISAVL